MYSKYFFYIQAVVFLIKKQIIKFVQTIIAAAAQRLEDFHITCPKSSESCFLESSSSSVRLQIQAVMIRVERMMARMRMLNSSKRRTGTQVMRRRQAWQMF